MKLLIVPTVLSAVFTVLPVKAGGLRKLDLEHEPSLCEDLGLVNCDFIDLGGACPDHCTEEGDGACCRECYKEDMPCGGTDECCGALECVDVNAESFEFSVGPDFRCVKPTKTCEDIIKVGCDLVGGSCPETCKYKRGLDLCCMDSLNLTKDKCAKKNSACEMNYDTGGDNCCGNLECVSETDGTFCK